MLGYHPAWFRPCFYLSDCSLLLPLSASCPSLATHFNVSGAILFYVFLKTLTVAFVQMCACWGLTVRHKPHTEPLEAKNGDSSPSCAPTIQRYFQSQLCSASLSYSKWGPWYPPRLSHRVIRTKWNDDFKSLITWSFLKIQCYKTHMSGCISELICTMKSRGCFVMITFWSCPCRKVFF
jgi:hypothetical protein